MRRMILGTLIAGATLAVLACNKQEPAAPPAEDVNAVVPADETVDMNADINADINAPATEDTRTGGGDTRTGGGDTRTGGGDTRTGGGDTR